MKNIKRNVEVFDITAEGFWIRTPVKEYYLTRKQYPWFKDATDEEICDVSFIEMSDEHAPYVIIWHALGVDFDEVSIEQPEIIYHADRIRCVRRPDLFKGYQRNVKLTG